MFKFVPLSVFVCCDNKMHIVIYIYLYTYIYIYIKDNTPTCFGKDVLSSDGRVRQD